MSDKTVEEVLAFVKSEYDKAMEAGVWSQANAFKVIEKYIEDNSTSLTEEELGQMKKVVNTPVNRREVDEEEINGE